MREYGQKIEPKMHALCEQPMNHFQGLTPAHLVHMPALAEKLRAELLEPVKKSTSEYGYTTILFDVESIVRKKLLQAK